MGGGGGGRNERTNMDLSVNILSDITIGVGDNEFSLLHLVYIQLYVHLPQTL